MGERFCIYIFNRSGGVLVGKRFNGLLYILQIDNFPPKVLANRFAGVVGG
jgi:hypothetical protein